MFKVFITLFFSSFICFLAVAGMGGGMMRGKQMNASLLAGNLISRGNNDGTGSAAQFFTQAGNAVGLVVSPSGDIYLSENNMIRKIVVSGSTGVVTTFVTNIGLFQNGIALDSNGNFYTPENYYGANIRKITPGGTKSVFSVLGEPNGMAVDTSNNIYTFINCALYKFTPAGSATVFAGNPGTCTTVDGTSSTATFDQNYINLSLTYNPNTQDFFVADTDQHVIRKVTSAGVVSRFSGLAGSLGSTNGTSATSRYWGIRDIEYDNSQNALFVLDINNKLIRKVDMSGNATTLVGAAGSGFTDGASTTAQFSDGFALTTDNAGTIYIYDNYSIRKITSTGTVTTLAGYMPGYSGFVNGTGSAAKFNSLRGGTVDDSGNVFVLDNGNDAIRKITPQGVVTTFASGLPCSLSGGHLLYHPNTNIYMALPTCDRIYQVTSAGVITVFAGSGADGSADGTSATATFTNLRRMAINTNGDIIIADNHGLRKVTMSGTVTTYAGSVGTSGNVNGASATARFTDVASVVVDSSNNVYVGRQNGGEIRKITSDGVVSLFVGDHDNNYQYTDSSGTAVRLGNPRSMVIDPLNNIYFCDSVNYSIRKMTASGVVTTSIGRKSASGSINLIGAYTGVLPGSIPDCTNLAYRNKIIYLFNNSQILMYPAK